MPDRVGGSYEGTGAWKDRPHVDLAVLVPLPHPGKRIETLCAPVKGGDSNYRTEGFTWAM